MGRDAKAREGLKKTEERRKGMGCWEDGIPHAFAPLFKLILNVYLPPQFL
jgi:hypothetical protein